MNITVRVLLCTVVLSCGLHASENTYWNKVKEYAVYVKNATAMRQARNDAIATWLGYTKDTTQDDITAFLDGIRKRYDVERKWFGDNLWVSRDGWLGYLDASTYAIFDNEEDIGTYLINAQDDFGNTLLHKLAYAGVDEKNPLYRFLTENLGPSQQVDKVIGFPVTGIDQLIENRSGKTARDIMIDKAVEDVLPRWFSITMQTTQQEFNGLIQEIKRSSSLFNDDTILREKVYNALYIKRFRGGTLLHALAEEGLTKDHWLYKSLVGVGVDPAFEDYFFETVDDCMKSYRDEHGEPPVPPQDDSPPINPRSWNNSQSDLKKPKSSFLTIPRVGLTLALAGGIYYAARYFAAKYITKKNSGVPEAASAA